MGVPVKVNVALSLAQITVGVTDTLAVGKGSMVRVTLLGCGLTQLGVPELATLTILIVVLAEYVPVMVAVPEPFRTIV